MSKHFDLKRVFEFEYVAIQVTCILLYVIKDTVIQQKINWSY